MKKLKQYLAILLVTTLMTGSVCVPALGARTGQASGAAQAAAAAENVEEVSVDESPESEPALSASVQEDASTAETSEEVIADAEQEAPPADEAEEASSSEDEGEEAKGKVSKEEAAESAGTDRSGQEEDAASEDTSGEIEEASEKDADDGTAGDISGAAEDRSDDSASEKADDESSEKDAEPSEEHEADDQEADEAGEEDSSSSETDPAPQEAEDDASQSAPDDSQEAGQGPDDSSGNTDNGAEAGTTGPEAASEEAGLPEDAVLTELPEEEAVTADAASADLLDGETETSIEAQDLTEDITINGDAVFDGGILDLNGHTLKINGNLLQPNGILLVGSGRLEVTGDYRIQSRSVRVDDETGDTTVSYGAANGVLAMHDEDGYVKIGGSFYTAADPDYVNKENNRIYDTFTAGIFEIGTGFYQTESGETAVRASGTHRFLLKAGTAHTVSFTNGDCRMAVLEAESEAVTQWAGYFNVGKLGSDVSIQTADAEGDGITIRSESARMDFFGHNLTVDGNVRSIEGLLYIGGASLAEDGERPSQTGSLTVNGNIVQPEGTVVVDGGSLTVTGDYRIQCRNNDGSYGASNGELAMHDDTDYVKVGGSFYTAADPDYVNKYNQRIYDTFTAGTFEIGAGFYQTESGETAVRASGTHRFLLKAGTAHTVSFTNRDCRMAVLEAESEAVTQWAGYLNVGKLASDVSIQAASAEGDGITIRSEGARMDFFGHNLTVEGNVRSIEGLLYIGGASLAGEEGRPAAMGSLTVNGNIVQPEGTVVVDGGSLTVTGDYRIQSRNNDGSYGASNGELAMHDDTDYVKVGGSFYTAADPDYVNKYNQRIYDTFTAGTFEIGAGFYQTESGETAVRASGTHRFLLKAGTAHTVSFTNRDCRMAVLEAESEAVTQWAGYLNVGKLGSDVSIQAASAEGDGITIRSDDARMDFYGHELTVNGNIRSIVGKLYIGGASLAGEGGRPAAMGSLTVNGNILQPEGAVVVDGGSLTVTGDYRLQYRNSDGIYSASNGVLAMHDENDSVKIEGSFYTGADPDYVNRDNTRINDVFTAGTLEIGGDFFQTESGERAFCATGTHRTILNGAGTQVVQFANSDSRSRFQTLELSQNPSSYIFSRIPCWNTLIYNGEEIQESAFAYTAATNPKEKTLTITGWTDESTQIVIPASLNGYTVTGIGYEVFRNRTTLSKITLPDTLREIGESTFYGCSALAAIEFPASVTSIGAHSFRDCTALVAVTFADGSRLESIGNSAFENDQALTAVSIPEGTQTLGQYAFYGCAALQKVSMPASVTSMGSQIFQNTALTTAGPAGTGTEYDYEFSWTDSVPANAFNYIQTLTAVKIPDTVTRIGEYAFYNCKNLPQITLPAGLTALERSAFSECRALSGSVSLAALEELGAYAFYHCENLEQVDFGQTGALTAIPEGTFNGCRQLASVNLPDSITAVDENAFRNCASFTEVTIPAAVTSIGNNAFRDCVSMAAVTFGEDSQLVSIGSSAFENNPDNNPALAAVSIPAGVTKLGQYAFYGCTNLTKVTLPASVNEMGIQVFRDTGLTTAGPIGSGADYEFGWTKAVPAYGFDYITTLTELTLPDSITTLGRNAIAECQALPAVTLPQSLTTMGKEVFSGCESLQRIEIPEGIEILPESALRRCKALTEAVLPTTLTTIQYSAFEQCESLREIVLPDSLREIGSYAFNGCAGLQSITFPEGLTYLPDRCLINCRSLTEVTLPDSLREIQGWAFENCLELTVVEIPDGVTTIGSLVFKNAPKLAQLIVPESVTSMGSDAFLETNSSGLVMYVVPDSAAEQYAIDHGIPYENSTALGQTVTVQVKDPSGEAVTTGFSAYWYNAETEEYLGTGTKLRNVAGGTKLLCSVLLDETLGTMYAQPGDAPVDGPYEAGSGNGIIEVSLQAFEKAAVSGTVRDAAGEGIPGASVKLKQTYNGTFDRTTEVNADGNGAFTITADRVRSVLTVSADGYYDSTYTIAESSMQEGAVTVDAVLEMMPADKITLSLVRQDAALEGEDAQITQITNAAALTFAVFNEAADRAVTDFRVQYPYMTLGEGAAAAGDTLRLSLTDTEGTMTAQDATVTLDETRCGTVEWTLVQNGSIRLTGITSEAVSADGTAVGTAVMVFDAQGRNVGSGSAGTSYSTDPLPAGEYQCVLMEKTSMLRSLDSYGKLAELGLIAGTDYANVTVQVQNGLITVEDNITVPDFDETKLYYTVADSTRFWANYATAATAQYVTLRAMYEIDEKHDTTGEALLFEIPEGMQFVEQSLTVGGRPASCSAEENGTGGTTITVPVGARKGTVRFYVIPVSSGTRTAHAFLSFKTGGETILQPIGSVSVDVKAASITVPSRTCFTNVTASGKTAKNSRVTVYDNGKKVGTTTANKNGSWSLAFDLVRPRRYSWHEIYAEIQSDEYGSIETEKAGILYNANYSELAKVTMINTAHPDDSLRPTEFRTVFDFLHPENAIPTYNYWPSYPTFTFLVEFTGADASVLSGVRVITTNSAGDRTTVSCNYDEVSNAWIGTHNYRSFSDVPCRVSVLCTNESSDVVDESMDLEDLTEILTEARAIDDTLMTMAEDFADVQNETIDENRVCFDLTEDDEKIGEYSIVLLDYADFDLNAWKKDRYVEYRASDGTTSYEAAWLTDDSYTIYSAYPSDRIYVKEVFRLTPGASASGTAAQGSAGFRAPLSNAAVYAPSKTNLTLDDWTNTIYKRKKFKDKTGKVLKDISGIQDAVNLGNDFLNVGANESTLRHALGEYKNAIIRKKCKCITKDMKDGYWRDAEDIEKQIDDYVRRANILLGGTYAAGLVMDYCGGKLVKFGGRIVKAGGKKLYKAAMARYGGKVSRSVRRAVFHGVAIISDEVGGYIEQKMGALSKHIMGLFDVKGVISDGFIALRDYIRASIKNLTLYKCPCEKGGGKCECDPEDPAQEDEEEEEPDEHGGGPDGGSYVWRSVVPKADPSGYVYEAVPSNRVEGVTATIYQYTYAEDEFGVQADEKSEILWNAEDYDQINPQTTDAYGTFGWDVPEGDWVVMFEKAGYLNADSYDDPAAVTVGENGKHYLPVPPIQTEVNTAMVSKAAPKVTGVQAYEDEIQIDFSQYMQIDTVNAANVTVKKADGTPVTGIIEALNAENAYNDENTQYASSFAFKPAGSEGALSGTVTVSVAAGVKNYAGTAMTDPDSRGDLPVTVMPKALEISGSLEVMHHDSGELTIRVQPAAAGANRTLTITSYSPSIVSAQAQTVTTDADGLAKVTVSGSLPGQGVLSIALDGTKLEEETQITVQAIPQIQSLDDGTHEITLSADSFTYNAAEQKPGVSIEGLTEGTDFTVEYGDDNVNAGTKTVTVKGIGSYTGTLTKDYTIARAPIKTVTVTGLQSKTYTGEKQTQKLTLKLGSYTLKSGTDYSITYKNNIDANLSTAETKPTVTIKGKGNFAGTVYKYFTIKKAAQTLKCTLTTVSVGQSLAFTVKGAQGRLKVVPADKTIAAIPKLDQAAKKFTVKGAKVGTVKLAVQSAATANYAVGKLTLTLKVVPAATTSLTAANQATGIRLTWKKVTGATGYLVYRGSTKIATITRGTTVAYTDTKANTNGTKYTYKVFAKASTGTSRLNKAVTTYRVARPAVKTLKNSAAGKMTVTWGKNAKATGYQIQYSTSKTFASGNKIVTAANASTVSKVIAGLTKGKTYYVRIRTYKTVSSVKYYSAWSAAKNLKITR